MPWGSFMAGTCLTQQHNDSHKYYHCKQPGRVCANCPDLKKKKKGKLKWSSGRGL